MAPQIVVSAVAIVRDGAVLTVRKQGTDRFMLVGGKPEAGENARACAVRETREETGLEVTDLELLGEFTSPAANEPGHELVSTVYLADPVGEPVVAAEIAELRWTDLDGEYDDLAPMLEFNVLPLLRQRARSPRPLLFYGMTPPRLTASVEDSQRVADLTLARLSGLDVDALVLYDIDDESDRNPDDRPFPYSETQDPVEFHRDRLAGWTKPVVLYRCVGKYPTEQLGSWMAGVDTDLVSTVFVGASSGDKPVKTTLREAQELRAAHRPDLTLGAVAIAERHSSTGSEHERMLRKQSRGVSFFVTQVVYDVDAVKSMVSDYHYACVEAGRETNPVVFTLSVCGSLKTLEFMEWLGVDVPRWVRNDLVHSADPLTVSFERCLHVARDLAAFCRRLDVPFGFNVESVAIRKAEIEATVELARLVRRV